MSQESLDIVRSLVTLVSRTFYEDKFVLALDFLNRKERAREDVLAKYLHVQSREVHKICGKLREDKLLRSEKRAEAREPGQQPFQRTYYHLDYKLFVDVVKWRMWKLQTLVKAKMEQELQKLGYECPSCSAHYSTMEALSLVDFASGLFLCDNCGAQLEDNKDSEFSQESQKELSRFMEQCQPIINLLKKTDSIILPPPTPFSEVPPPDMSGDQDAGFDGKGQQGNGKELNVARDTGINTGEIVIGFAPDLTPKEAARIREAELERKRRQNALPAWHIWSTVSGVQMVVDQKITPDARAVHGKYVEKHQLLRHRWDKRARAKARIAERELAEAKQIAAAGQRELKEEREEQDEAKREGLYSRYYSDIAERVGIDLPHDPREGYQHLLDQLAREEEHERAEKEKRRLEQEKIEKEMQEAAAANSTDKGPGSHGYRRYRSKYSHHHADRSKGAHDKSRPAWKMSKRLFAFADLEPAKPVDGATAAAAPPNGARQPSPEASKVPDSADQTAVPAGAEDAVVEDADCPDPYLEGIYALSQSKRRKLGLYDVTLEELSDAVPDSIVVESPDRVPNVDIYVDGQSKSAAHITAEDEDKMTLQEYTEYWNVWHQAQRQAQRQAQQ